MTSGKQISEQLNVRRTIKVQGARFFVLFLLVFFFPMPWELRKDYIHQGLQ